MSYLASSPNAYRESAVLTATPEQLVVMLYDGARRFLYQASTAMRNDNIQLAHQKLRRGEAIITHLRDTLDMDQGEVAARLQAIYLFCNRHLNDARVQRDAEKIDQVSSLLGELRSAWSEIGNV
ncbi:MAG TPA: flagellar export chaperone FliS [Solirubrobacteraceae bacterium]|nr:flagellar export chaperone FliS [Solirubrobacteraceae bacterium]